MFIPLFKATMLLDPSRSNRFLVWLPGMPYDLLTHCTQVTVPGEQFATTISHDPIIGQNVIPWELPYDLTQNECSMTFMLDHTYRIKSYFDRWRKEVYDPKRGFGYMEDYAKDIKIFQLSRQHIPTYTTTLTNAWPKTISDINFDASAQNLPNYFTVTFVYGGQLVQDTLGWVLSKVGVERPAWL